MSYRRPQNPAVISNAKFRQFEGIGGPKIQILQRFNERGWDISNNMANEVVDLDLLESGSMYLRNGSRKINYTGETGTITNLFYITVGGVRAYGVVVGGALKVISMPSVNVRKNPLTLTPANSADAVATVYVSADPSIRYP